MLKVSPDSYLASPGCHSEVSEAELAARGGIMRHLEADTLYGRLRDAKGGEVYVTVDLNLANGGSSRPVQVKYLSGGTRVDLFEGDLDE